LTARRLKREIRPSKEKHFILNKYKECICFRCYYKGKAFGNLKELHDKVSEVQVENEFSIIKKILKFLRILKRRARLDADAELMMVKKN
jgi:hypothetical protein